MKRKLAKFFNLVKNDNQTKFLTIIFILLMFIFSLGYSLSIFNGNNLKDVANINVNGLSFNITTNNATSNDRILHLKAGKTELFNVIITNLNNINTTYELIYDICTNSSCTNTLNDLPNGVKVEYLTENSDTLNGKINNNKGTKTINIITINTTSNDIYIRLNLNAGYEWNNLVLSNKIKEYKNETYIIAYVDGVETKKYPENCNYKAIAKAYIGSQEVNLENLTVTCSSNKWTTNYIGFADRIEVKFTYGSSILANYFLTLDKASNGLEVDDTPDENLRYVGASPKNYINFNGETWRIIGVFNNIITIDEQGNKKTESLVKIVRDESLGNYSWDSSESDINGGYGVNEWSRADLKKELNTDYINTSKTSGTTLWYNDENNTKKGTYEYKNNIKSNFIDKIATVRWNTNTPSYRESALNSYKRERSTDIISTPSDNFPRRKTWDGKIALIYPSDYGYASINEACRNNMYSSANSIYNCKNDNWLFKNTVYWTLTPYSGYPHNVFVVNRNGAISTYSAYYSNSVFPAVFLKSDLLIASGTGEIDNEYHLG